MRADFLSFCLLNAAALSFLPFVNAFLNANALRSVISLDKPWSHNAILPREDDEEDTNYDSGLGDCVRRCELYHDREKVGSSGRKRRSTALYDDASCPFTAAGYSGCSHSQNGSSDPLEERAPLRRRALPTGNEDLRRKTTAELGAWIVARTNQPDVRMIWDQNDPAQYIELTILTTDDDGSTYNMPYAIPTSFFETPGNQGFAWATRSLVGCSAMFAVKTPDGNTQDNGVYMAHMWEVPGFDNHVVNGEKIMNPQVGSYITNFLQKGFPHAGINRRTPENQRDPTYANTAYQQGLNDVGTNLKDGTAIIVHPRKYELGDDDAYHLGDGPQHGKPLGKVREAADKAMAKFGSQLTFLEDFLYVPNREQNNLGSYTGRTLVEYDPHYEIQPGVFRRMVMVLLENGGPRGAQNDDGTYEPGPGGPFFFDFGP